MVLDAFGWFSLIITSLTIIYILANMIKNRELRHIPAVFGWSAALMFEILYYFKIY